MTLLPDRVVGGFDEAGAQTPAKITQCKCMVLAKAVQVHAASPAGARWGMKRHKAAADGAFGELKD